MHHTSRLTDAPTGDITPVCSNGRVTVARSLECQRVGRQSSSWTSANAESEAADRAALLQEFKLDEILDARRRPPMHFHSRRYQKAGFEWFVELTLHK